MKRATRQDGTSWLEVGFPLRAVPVFALSYLYVWLVLDPRLLYRNRPAAFLLDRAFFERFLGYVGGPVEYAAAFLTQFYYYPWAGAAVIVGLVLGSCLATRSILSRLGGRPSGLLPFVPPVLVLVLLNGYTPMISVLAMFLALLFTVCYVRCPLRRSALRLGVFVVLSGLLYYLAAGPFLLFAAMCGIYELLAARRRFLGAACFVLGALWPYAVARWLFEPELLEFYLRWMPLKGAAGLHPVFLALYVFFPAAAIGVIFQDALARAGRRIAGGRGLRLREWFSRGRIGRAVAALSLVVVVAVPVALTFDGGQRAALRLRYLMNGRRWEEALAAARRCPVDTIFSRHAVVRALYHTGRLPDEMFSYRQRAGAPDLFLDAAELEQFWWVYRMRSDIYFDLGRVNESGQQAHEALAHQGEGPALLERLALISVLKGRPQAARTFLGVLEKTLWHRASAREWRRRLDADASLSQDPQVQRVRSRMLKTDYLAWRAPLGSYAADQLLRQCLVANKMNRMAFEYLMAHYLLVRSLDGFAASLPHVKDFAYSGMPRHYAEAIVLYAHLSNKRLPDTLTRLIRPETFPRFQEFMGVYGPHRHDSKAAWRALVKDFGDTYWFFFTFGRTGAAGPPSEEGETS